jgi:hypothetical protein
VHYSAEAKMNCLYLQLILQVVELLRHAPQCSMLFNKFIPAYHHHYGHQCRVADYGFTKLIELFEAIPQVAKVLGQSYFEQLNTSCICLNHFLFSSKIDFVVGLPRILFPSK